MLPGLTLPASLRRLLDAFAGGFTKPTFIVFTAMVVGMIAQTGSKTVCGMLAGAGLAQTWSHDRVHRFFARAAWSIDAIGLIVLYAKHLQPDREKTARSKAFRYLPIASAGVIVCVGIVMTCASLGWIPSA